MELGFTLTEEGLRVVFHYANGPKCVENGAGELYITNIDFDGRRKGYDLDSLKEIEESVQVPIIVFGGAMDWGAFCQWIGCWCISNSCC